MYQLYASPNTYAIGVHLLLEELHVPYRIIDPATESFENDAGFHAASPHRRVPALVSPTGITMCESGAIALHLADTFGRQKFTVAADDPQRGKYLQWLFYLSSTLQPEVMLQFHPENYFSDRQQQNWLMGASMQRISEIWNLLDTCYAGKIWLFNNTPTAVDFSLATALLWPECFDSPIDDYSNLHRLLQSISGRPSFQRIKSWHGRETDISPCRTE